IDGDVAEEVGVVFGCGYGDGVAGRRDGRVGDDLLDGGFVGAGKDPAGVGVDVANDVDLVVRAGVDVDVSGAGGDGEGWGSRDGEGFVEGAVRIGGGGGGGECGCGESDS